MCRDHIDWVDYKDVPLLRKYMSDRGKIRSRRVTGNCAQHQRDIALAIKTARELVLLPYTQRTVTERPGGRGGRGGRGDRGDRATAAIAAAGRADRRPIERRRRGRRHRRRSDGDDAGWRSPRPWRTTAADVTERRWPYRRRGDVMKVLLRSDVDGVGRRGDIVDVSGGFARNFLLPEGQASWPPRASRRRRPPCAGAATCARPRTARRPRPRPRSSPGRSSRSTARAGTAGRLFGSVGAADVVEAVQRAEGRRARSPPVGLDEPIKSVGSPRGPVAPLRRRGARCSPSRSPPPADRPVARPAARGPPACSSVGPARHRRV